MQVGEMIRHDLKCVRAEATVSALKETETMAIDDVTIQVVFCRFTAALGTFADFGVGVLLQVQIEVTEDVELFTRSLGIGLLSAAVCGNGNLWLK